MSKSIRPQGASNDVIKNYTPSHPDIISLPWILHHITRSLKGPLYVRDIIYIYKYFISYITSSINLFFYLKVWKDKLNPK